MAGNPLLKIKDLSISYGPIKAVENLSMEVNEGSIVAVLGSNGAGKTTLLKKISGIAPSHQGQVLFEDEDITHLPPEKITRKGIIQAPEGRKIFGELSTYDNLVIGAFTVEPGKVKIKHLYEKAVPKRIQADFEAHKDNPDHEVEMTRDEIIYNNLTRVYDLFPVLKERKDQTALTLSGGEQQMLAIGRALMSHPKLLILDEPSLGLAPLIIKDIFETIQGLKKLGTTILIIEQNALQTLKISDYAYVLQTGKKTQEGKAETLMNNEDLVEAYLGKTAE
ncbi:MAG: ABC transporter ATP-binding protein [Bacillota bacterium]